MKKNRKLLNEFFRLSGESRDTSRNGAKPV